MAKKPTVVSTSPSGYDKDIATNISISIVFDVDLDPRYIDGSVAVMDSSGSMVDGRTLYRKKTLTFVPASPLAEGTEYHVRVIGDTDLDDDVKSGIRSIVGAPMAGVYTFSFTTEAVNLLPAPGIVTPVHHSQLKESPVFLWDAVEGAAYYEIELSVSNTFSNLLFPQAESTPITETTVIPDVEWEDRIYYWRIRSVDKDGRAGLWGSVVQFNLTRYERGPISEEDPDPDGFVDNGFQSFELELIESFPKDLQVQLPLTIHALYFRVIGDIDLSQIDIHSVKLHGTHISDDYEDESHGLVEGKITIVNSNDGTTYIVYTLDPLPVEEVET